MIIHRDRFFEHDRKTHHVALELRSQGGDTHSLIEGLPREKREIIGAALVKALDCVERQITGKAPERVPLEMIEFVRAKLEDSHQTQQEGFWGVVMAWIDNEQVKDRERESAPKVKVPQSEFYPTSRERHAHRNA